LLEGAEADVTDTYLGENANGVSYETLGSRDGEIYKGGTLLQSGLATAATAGDRLGVELINDAGSLSVQFWVNGTQSGTAVSLADGRYRLGASTFFEQVEAPSDPYIDSVVSLLHFDGADGSTTFTDVTGKAWNAAGNAQIDTAQSKFGGASMVLDGSGDWLRTAAHPDFDFGTGDFTIEAWIRPASFTADRVIVTRYTHWSDYVGFYLGTRAGSPNILIFRAGNSVPIVLNGNTALSVNTWVHVAVARVSGVTRMFVDGVTQTATHTGSVNITSASVVSVGAGPTKDDENFDGYIDELRITKGVGRYTANFTPPSAQFPDPAPPPDPDQSQSVSLVLRCDAPELRYLPAGAQPWGAAALVADRGGYSPGATLWNASEGTISVDAFRKTATYTGLDANKGSHRADNSPDHSRAHRLLFVEFSTEIAGSENFYMGLHPFDTSVGYLGTAATSYAVSTNGTKRNNDTNTVAATWTRADGNRYGVFWDPSTGNIWFALNGVVAEGDPEAGTGASFTSAVGLRLVPAATWEADGQRIRLCTHAREQLYRPAYAEAWDGADLLPEQHFIDRLKRAPSVRREVSYYPWANQRNRGAAIGDLDLNNADGALDALSEYDLRDQPIIAYRARDDGSTAREFTGLVDGVTQPDARTCRIVIADTIAKLNVRIDSPVFALGQPELIDVTPRIGLSNTYDVCQFTDNAFSVYDAGLLETDWERDDTAEFSGFTRTDSVFGRQSVRGLEVLRSLGAVAILNGEFTVWTGGEPDDWDVFTSGIGSSVTQNGSAAVFSIPTGSAIALLFQNFTSEDNTRYAFRIKVNAVSFGTGVNFTVGIGAETTDLFNTHGDLPEVGEFVAYVDVATGAATNLNISLNTAVGSSASIEIDSISVFKADETSSVEKALTYLVEDLALQPATFWSYTAHFGEYSPGIIGFWTNSRPTVRLVFDEVCESVLVDYYPDEYGVQKLAWLVPPEEVDSADAEWCGEIAERDMYGELSVADDYAPRLSTIGEYQRNYAQHNDGEIAGAATAEIRTYFTSVGRENVLDVSSPGAGDAGPLHPFYAFANSAPPMPRLCVNDFNNSNTPIGGYAAFDNRLIMLYRCYMQRRRFYRFRLSREKFDELNLRPGGVCEVTHRRYGLSSGKNMMCVAVEPQLMSPTVAVTFWG
jgi:hypothetical protein